MDARRGIELADLLAVWSLALGYQNLRENEEQSAHNDVQKANDQQAAFLLESIGARLDAQDEKLDEILRTVKHEGNQGAGGSD